MLAKVSSAKHFTQFVKSGKPDCDLLYMYGLPDWNDLRSIPPHRCSDTTL